MPTALITVRCEGSADPMAFEVSVREGGDETRHNVTMSKHDGERLAGGRMPEKIVEAAFCFLLDREAKESILPRFDIMVIARYFPEFERELPRYLAQKDSRDA